MSEKSEKSEKFWNIHSSSIKVDDPLLGCLVMLTRLYNKPATAENLTAGLPLVEGKLTPELFVRSAKRVNISSQIVPRALNKISSLVLPAVLLLKDLGACLLVKIKKNNVAVIVQPETGDGVREIRLEQLEKLYTGYAVFTRPSYVFEERAEEGLEQKKSKHWFWGVVVKIWPFYVHIIVASVLINFFALFSPLFTMNVYDRVVPNNAFETLTVLAVGMATVYLFDLIMKTLRAYFIDVAGKKADVILSAKIYEHMMGIKMESLPSSVGSFANNITAFDSFREFITSTTISFIIDVPFSLLFLYMMYFIGGSVVFVPLIAIPIVLIAGFVIQRPLNAYVKESYKFSSQRQAMLIETLIAVENIKTVNAESPMQRKWEHLAGISSKNGIKIKVLNSIATNFTAFVQQIATIGIVVVGVLNISEGLMTMGALIACNMLSSRALSPLGQVASIITRYEQAKTSLNSVDSVMKMPVERDYSVGKIPTYYLNGNIDFKDVSFKYAKSEVQTIKNMSFSIRKGEKIAIVGKIGSGKTTIEKLIMGLYQPTEGHILFDGIESQQLDISSVRKNIGYVPQDITLFYGSIKDNIVMGAPYIDENSLFRAANISGVSEMISSNPKGFELQVGERGSNLSGGQRQSIAIARALLLDPSILLFDEATNMMDITTEMNFINRLSTIIPEKTLIVVTHTGHLLNLVDRIIVVDQGSLIADGPRDEIIKALNEGKIKVT